MIRKTVTKAETLLRGTLVLQPSGSWSEHVTTTIPVMQYMTTQASQTLSWCRSCDRVSLQRCSSAYFNRARDVLSCCQLLGMH